MANIKDHLILAENDFDTFYVALGTEGQKAWDEFEILLMDGANYEQLAEWSERLLKYNVTFDYYLDAEPFNIAVLVGNVIMGDEAEQYYESGGCIKSKYDVVFYKKDGKYVIHVKNDNGVMDIEYNAEYLKDVLSYANNLR